MATIPEAFALALQQHQAGNLGQAERIYEQILQADPAHADARHLLGVLAYQTGRHELAVASIRHALALTPGVTFYHSNLGLALEALGHLDEAVVSYRQALGSGPGFPEATCNLANALFRQGNQAEAAVYYRQTLALRPDHAAAHCGLGLALAQLGKREEGIAHLQEAVRLNPDYAEAHNNLGNVLEIQGRPEEAITHWRLAVRCRPDFAEAHNNLGNVLVKLDRLDEAAASYREALRINPRLLQAHHGLGNALDKQSKFAEAVQAYRQALSINPDFAATWNNLGNVLHRQEKFEEASEALRQAIRADPGYSEAHYNFGNTLQQLDKFAEAIHSYQEAIRLRPNFPDAINNLGYVLMLQGKSEEAIGCYGKALALQPGLASAHWNRALANLLLGNFEEGWPEYEWRWDQPGNTRRPFVQPRWDGSDLGGRTILLYAEQGLGDVIQFIRYVPKVKERGGRVIVECQAPLMRLLSGFAGIDCLVAVGATLPPFDIQMPLGSLPVTFHTGLTTIPKAVPYLQADTMLVEKWRKELTRLVGFEDSTRPGTASHGMGCFKIGISWQGNPTYVFDRHRSFPVARFSPLAQVEGVKLISLQKGPGSDQLSKLANPFPVLDLGSRLDEEAGAFMDTAAVMKDLDLVISSDTAIAHLAGALGVPVWVALSLVPDWRWLLDRQDSPWYPSMRLFRQTKHGQWDEVFAKMAEELKNRQIANASRLDRGAE